MSSIDHAAAEFLLLTVGAKQAYRPFGRLQAKAAMPQVNVESEERGQERMDAIPREMAAHRRLEAEVFVRGEFDRATESPSRGAAQCDRFHKYLAAGVRLSREPAIASLPPSYPRIEKNVSFVGLFAMPVSSRVWPT
jgi:hypothetical protein